MDLGNLYSLQLKLDEKINITHNIINMHLTNKKILALNVELSELANETRCFKFWSLKKSSQKNIVLEEFVDCLHFMLSIGLDFNFKLNIDEINISKQEYDLTELFLQMFNNINVFYKSQNKNDYINIFSSFLTLGYNLGFSFKDIEMAYLKKNCINHQRQENGY